MAAAGAVFLWASSAAGLCWASPATEMKVKKGELKRVQGELESTRREISALEGLERNLGSEIGELESKNEESHRKLSGLKRNLDTAEKHKRDLQGKLRAVGLASGYFRSSLGSDLRAYVSAGVARDDFYGTSSVWKEELRRRLILEEGVLLSSLRGVGETTRLAEAATRRQTDDLRGKAGKLQSEEDENRRRTDEKRAAAEQARQKHEAAVKRVRDLEETAQALTHLIKNLGRRVRGKGSKAPALAKIEIGPHSLIWPAAGSVLKSFGRQKNAELDGWFVNQGILMETVPGAAVESVARGRVIFAGPFRSYGQVMILDHGSDLFSIYGRLGEFFKAKGDEVGAGQVIARAGSESGRGRLYFELRHGAEALDPAAWLKKKAEDR